MNIQNTTFKDLITLFIDDVRYGPVTTIWNGTDTNTVQGTIKKIIEKFKDLTVRKQSFYFPNFFSLLFNATVQKKVKLKDNLNKFLQCFQFLSIFFYSFCCCCYCCCCRRCCLWCFFLFFFFFFFFLFS